jgi:hypothetical protein
MVHNSLYGHPTAALLSLDRDSEGHKEGYPPNAAGVITPFGVYL